MTSDIFLRRAEAPDAAAIADVFIEARTRCLPYLNVTYDPKFMADLFASRIGETEFWVAIFHGQVVGFIRYDQDEIHDLYVHPAHHGQGFGTALLDGALADITGTLRLWVFTENRQARRFYEGHGFELEFETDGSGNMEKCPDCRYVLRR